MSAPEMPAQATVPAVGAAQPVRGLPGTVSTLVALAALAIVLAALRTASDVIAPTILALVLAIAVAPLQVLLARRLPGWLAMFITIIVTYVGLVVLVGALGWALYAFGSQIPQYQDDFNNLVAQVSDRLADFGVSQEQIQGLLGNVDLGAAAGIALNVAQGLYGAITQLGFILALLFFLIIDIGSFGSRFAAVKRIRPSVAASMTAFAVGVRRYLVVTTVFGLIVAAFDVVLLYILGVPLPLVWGVLAFVTGFIPTVGLIIGLVPPVIIALLALGWPAALIVLIGYLVINNVIQSVIQPKFIGDAVGLGISMSFLSLVVWGFVLGPLGALLAIPMSLMARAILTDGDPRHSWLDILVSDRAPAEDRIRRLAIATGGEAADPHPAVDGGSHPAGTTRVSAVATVGEEPPDLPGPRVEPTS